MEVKTKINKVKVLIVIISIFLGANLLSLAGTLIYNNFANSTPASFTVSDNLISLDDKDTVSTSSMENSIGLSNTAKYFTNIKSTPKTSSGSGTSTTNSVSVSPSATIYLHNKNDSENKPFNITNMFPGDKELKYYRVKISYHDVVTVHFKVDILNGYEKLAEVLKVKVTLQSADTVMYDSLIKDMPKSVSCKITSPKSTTDELSYEITTYLDSSVGNEYMEKNLVADFKWWVEETGNLDPPPTGDNLNITLLIAGVSLIILIIIYLSYKKRGRGGLK